MTVATLDLSIVIPLFNEAESLPELMAWIERVKNENGIDRMEVILVDDGSTDGSWKVISDIKKTYPWIKAIRFRRNYGKSGALQMGFKAASGEIVITMDADLQDSPEEIPGLMQMIREENYDLVSGWKKHRKDPLSKTLPSKLFNSVIRGVSKIKLHDFNCGLKAYKIEVVKDIFLYSEMHRYIPAIAQWAGYGRIGEKIVQHQERKYGRSKFGWMRLINGFLDLLTLYFFGKFGKRPMHFFGLLGIIFFLIGFGILAYLSWLKIIEDIVKISDRPIFYFGIIGLIIGSQLFLTGFLAEMVLLNSPYRSTYKIAETIDVDQDSISED